MMRKLRIICLHGYHGSADIMESQARLLVEELKDLADFYYLDAPSLAKGDHGWWHAIESNKVKGPGVHSAPVSYKGWAKTYEYIVSYFKDHGPFDGIFGFSQGAALAALLVGLRAPDGIVGAQYPLSFNFAILVGGFFANDPLLQSLYEAKDSYNLPSAHIIGRADFIVPSRYSYEVSALFKRPLVIEHNGGHVIDSSERTRLQLAFFLKEQIYQLGNLRN
ncbi:hypothetical protein [Pseudomonas gingeri]|uniref:hypothetical protein n=2 Tax=Pseudomonas gingeri TaxID=117681 RepID=UPI0015A12A21